MPEGNLAATRWTPEMIRALRQRLGVTQKLLAARLGCTVAAVSRWENGAASPQPVFVRFLDQLAEAGR